MKPIPEFPDYEVSEDGKVWSNKSNKFLSLWANNRGRLLATLSIEGSNKHFQVSRLVAYVYGLIPNLLSDLEVDHIDTNCTNNNLANLQALTAKEHLDKSIAEQGFSKRDKQCASCGNLLTASDPKTSFCRSCMPSKSPNITAEAIEHWVTNFSWSRAAKELGLSDNGLRKRYKNLTGNLASTIKSARKS